MKKVNTITEQELAEIKELISATQKVENEVLEFEFRKHHAMHLHADLSMKLDAAKKAIETNYGKINVNLETGEYTEIIEDAEVVE
jgi:hypothetical protein